MLVKRSIVERWYQRDSWVYKQFSYLFDNPLWHKRVPQGFSVCPYFWLSLFSFFVFKLFFVFPIYYVFRPIINLFGKPAKAIDSFFLKVAIKTGFIPPRFDKEYEYVTGVGSVAMLAETLVGSMMAAGLYFVGIVSYSMYVSFDGDPLGIFAFWSIASFVGLFAVLGIHKKITKTDCQTLNYLWVWLVLFAIATAIFIPSQFMVGMGVVLNFLKDAIIWLASSTWWVIVIAIKAVWWFLATVFSWKPFAAMLLPWWGFILLLSAVGWFADKVMNAYDRATEMTLRRDHVAEYKARNRRYWIDLFVQVLRTDTGWAGDCYFNKLRALMNKFPDDYLGSYFTAAKFYKTLLLEGAFEIMWKDKLDVLQDNPPNVLKLDVKTYRKRSGDSYLDAFGILSKELGIDAFIEDFDKLQTAIAGAYDLPEVRKLIENMARDIIRKNEERDKKRSAWYNGWPHQTCLKVTKAIGNSVRTIGSGFCKIGSQTATLFAYLWMLLKAKKQGACPYFQFTDPKK